jgi:hypothetical protein
VRTRRRRAVAAAARPRRVPAHLRGTGRLRAYSAAKPIKELIHGGSIRPPAASLLELRRLALVGGDPSPAAKKRTRSIRQQAYECQAESVLSSTGCCNRSCRAWWGGCRGGCESVEDQVRIAALGWLVATAAWLVARRQATSPFFQRIPPPRGAPVRYCWGQGGTIHTWAARRIRLSNRPDRPRSERRRRRQARMAEPPGARTPTDDYG